jgi:apolipoprotein D and lipocalin family protein
MRKGLGIGRGKGYYNLQYRDPYIHSLSAKGVKSVNLKRYAGKWYNQASIPTWFDKGCKNQTAQYNLKDGKIQVINSCDIDGTIKKIEGSARSVSADNSKLKVSFFPLVESDYIIEYLDDKYNYAVIGSSNKNYLWFLTRSKTISKNKYEEMLNIAKNKGYDIALLKQSHNLNARGELAKEYKGWRIMIFDIERENKEKQQYQISAYKPSKTRVNQQNLPMIDDEIELEYQNSNRRDLIKAIKIAIDEKEPSLHAKTKLNSRIMWNPKTKQFISGDESHSDLLRRSTKGNINEWVRAIYDKDSNTIYVRHYFNPKSHYAEFTAKDFENSEKQQKQFIKHLKLPKGVNVRYNSTNESLRQEGFIYV